MGAVFLCPNFAGRIKTRFCMKKLFLVPVFTLLAGFAMAQSTGGPIITSAVVPQYTQGINGTNNNRTPFWFWAEITGLTPGATYRYYTTLDSLNAISTSNGAGNPYFVNTTSGTVRRTTNATLGNPAGHDSLTADITGTIRGWFGVEPTGNGRFVPGATLYPKFMLNNGAGGTSVATRILASAYPVTVINYGVTAGSGVEGSALYDSLDAAPKNFICLYDNILALGRPVSIAIVENDGLDLYPVTSIASFYGASVDTLAGHWGTIVPNNLATGIRALEEKDFYGGPAIDTVIDVDGIWCYGTNTVNMSNGSGAMYLNSTFVLSSSAVIPDSTWTGISTVFTGNSNSPNSTYAWNYGDTGLDTGAVTSHTYLAPGVYNVQLIVYTGGCSDTINQTIVVELSTGIFTPLPLSFQVSPNPTEGELLITTRDNHEKTITVVNTLGETVSTGQLNGTLLRIDLRGNAPGIYFVQVKDEVTGKTGVKKIVLQ